MSNSHARMALLLAVAACAAVLRMAWLESTPLLWDEFVTLSRAKLPLSDIWTSLSLQGPSDASLDSSPPLLHAILHGVLALGGADETWVKLPSAVFGVLTVVVVHPLGTRLFGGRCGLYASALLAFSLYHVHYSREASPYSLYLLLSACSLWLLLRAMEHNRLRDWAAHALACAATLYASYLGGASLAAQALYVVLMAATRRIPGDRILPTLLSLAAACLAYLPWLPGHLFHMRLIRAPGGDMGLSREFFGRALSEFASGSSLLLACSALGAAVGLWRAPGRAALPLLWLALPVTAALALRTGITANPRYLINFVPALSLLAGAGLDALVRGVSLALPGRAAALLGLAAAVGLSWPSLAQIPDYYRRDSHSVRDDLLAVAENAANADTLAFPRNRHLKVFARWYLPGLFDDLSRSGDLRYRRVLLLVGPDVDVPSDSAPERYGDLKAWRTGLLNISPLPAHGPYKADFAGLSFYREAAFWENVGPDLFQKTLSLYDPERPGRALWRFTAPGGGFPQTLTLRCRLRLTASQAGAPDARVDILAGTGSDSLGVVRTVTQADFTAGQELDVSLPVRVLGREFCAGFQMEPGQVHGSLEPVLFEIDFPKSQAAPAPSLGRLLGRAALAAWTPGVIRAGDESLTAFAPDDPLLPGFLAAHPGIEPVARFPDLLLYDPALRAPLAKVPGPRVEFAASSLKGVRVTGPFTGQTLTLGDAVVRLPQEAPPGATLDVAPSGAGRIRADLDFSASIPKAFLAFDTTAVPGAACLTCSGENACFLVYALRSPAPIREIRVVWTPEACGEPDMENGVRLSLSTDGNAYTGVDSFSVARSEVWEGKKRRVNRVRLDAPSHLVYLRFELSSDKARLWAGPGTPMRIDAWTVPPAALPAALPQGPFQPVSDLGPVSVFLSPKPLPDLDRLLAPH